MAKNKIKDGLSELNFDTDITEDNQLLDVIVSNGLFLKEIASISKGLSDTEISKEFKMLNKKATYQKETLNGKTVLVKRVLDGIDFVDVLIMEETENTYSKKARISIHADVENQKDYLRLKKRALKNGMSQSAIFLDSRVERLLEKYLKELNEFLLKHNVSDKKGKQLKIRRKDLQNNILYDYLVINKYWGKNIFELTKMNEEIAENTEKMLKENYKGKPFSIFFLEPDYLKTGFYVHLDIYREMLKVQGFAFPSTSGIKGKRDFVNQVFMNYFKKHTNIDVFTEIRSAKQEIIGDFVIEDVNFEFFDEKSLKYYFEIEKFFDDNN